MDKKYTLSLCMVCKNEAANLRTLWASVKHICDEWIVVDTGSTDNTAEVARQLGAKVYEEGNRFTTKLTEDHAKFFNQYGVSITPGETVFEFAQARNYSFEKATKDFILWLDGDDILVGSRHLQTIIEENLDPRKQLGLHILYKYEQDQYGNSLVEHYRERVFPNNKTFKWQGRIHEIIIPTIETSYIRVAPSDCHVLHNVSSDRRTSSHNRNIRNLLLDLYDQGSDPDPRTIFYLAESIKACNEAKALELYQQYCGLSGWDEELNLAATRVTDIYLKQGDAKKALEWAFRAIQYKPDFPGGYANVAECYYQQDMLPECELFCKHALGLEQPDTVIMVNEKHNKFTPLLLLSSVYFKRGLYKDCLGVATEALKLEPQNEFLLSVQNTCQQALIEEEIATSYRNIYEYLTKIGDTIKARELFRSLPATHIEDPRLVQLAREANRRIKSDVEQNPLDKDLMILFGRGLKSSGAKTVHYFGVDTPAQRVLEQTGFARSGNDDKADAVVLHEVIDRVDNLGEFVNEIVSHVKPTGRVFLTTNVNPESRIRLFSTESLRRVLEACGVTVWNCFEVGQGRIYCEFLPGKVKDAKGSVAFICGESSEEWNPFSIYTGIGGSEEATIYLARELAAIGHQVTVFNTTTQQCTYDGVVYKHHATLNDTKEYDTAILWRVPHHLDEYKIKAKKIFLWLHDVPAKYWFTPDRMERIDKIIVLSQYHRSLLPDVPDDKFIISQNGVDLNQFNVKVERKRGKIIYTSSYDRGLEHLLNIWQEIRKEVPEAELHVFYGWGTFDKIRTEESSKTWKSRMLELLKQPGVFEHGRIGQPDLAKEMLSSDIYAYPCHFDEISCISAMKAQVAGCIPLTTDHAALAETNLTAYKIKGNPKEDPITVERFKHKLIELLQSSKPDSTCEAIQRDAKERFSWKNVARQWSQFMTQGEQK